MEERIIIQEKSAHGKSMTYLKNGVLLWVSTILLYALFCDGYLLPNGMFFEVLGLVIIIVLAFLGSRNLLLALLSRCEITVTTHRVYGRGIKEQVDLPLDSVSAVKKGWFGSVIVATSSGRIGFYMMPSQNKIFDLISELLRERQSAKATPPVSYESNADELKKYKELLDDGIITPEEFDAKKKQLLGL